MNGRQRYPILKLKMLNTAFILPSPPNENKRELIMVVTVWVTHPTAVHVRRVVQQGSISFTYRSKFLEILTE